MQPHRTLVVSAAVLLGATAGQAQISGVWVQPVPLGEIVLELPEEILGVAPTVVPPSEFEAAVPAASPAASYEALGDGLDVAPSVTASELKDYEGGSSLVLGSQTLTSVTSGNVLNGDYMAGAITLSDNAFSNFNGLGNILINTGAQVSLQSGTNLVINVSE